MQFLKLSHELITDKNITSNEFRVYTYLLSLYNAEKQCSYPSIDIISERLNISISTVKRSIKRLEELEYISIEKRKGLAGNFNIYKKLKHLITTKVINKKDKTPKVGIDSNGEKPLNGQISVEEALENIEEEPRVQSKQASIDNHNNVRMARAVTNIDNSNFAKKILTIADEELLREAIRNFKKRRGRNATFLIQMLVDEYYKAGIKFSQGMLNLLRKGLKFQNIDQVSVAYCY
ncbi:helix-turn-helix domain-containing protein [Clostridium saudiense]|jgi:predicted transcriptional regulator|uniref:helix-turn-helix domain-containing protein n=1 Tax=Clostridium saudiense TaxID=1414720 RepID=UPI0004B727F5|nr:helix-turn-helix domain-containing protein [Clostridium saudiense]SCJ53729.1 Iron dependent repressor%2C N-terminal DNA binding domain [uncultured Clostridium sp.]